MNAFIGVELEGPERGRYTLFIPKNCLQSDTELLEKAVHNKINRVYFGAGNSKGLNKDQLCVLLLFLSLHFKIVIEVDMQDIDNILSFLPKIKEIEIVICVDSLKSIEILSFLKSVVFQVSYKVIEKNDILWLSACTNKTDEILYSLDTE